MTKKRNRFYLDDEARKAVKGVPDHLIPLNARGSPARYAQRCC
jgi:hypothetical protein